MCALAAYTEVSVLHLRNTPPYTNSNDTEITGDQIGKLGLSEIVVTEVIGSAFLHSLSETWGSFTTIQQATFSADISICMAPALNQYRHIFQHNLPPNLRCLTLSGLGLPDGVDLRATLVSAPFLEELSLGRMMLLESTMEHLGEALQAMPSLSRLRLVDCSMLVDGVTALSKVVPHLKSLVEFEVSQVKESRVEFPLREFGSVLLSTAVSKSKSIERVLLYGVRRD
eukprot:1214852-Rhodomonas_salina.1